VFANFFEAAGDTQQIKDSNSGNSSIVFTGDYVKPIYKNVSISEDDIKKAIKELKDADLISILDSNGQTLNYDNIDEVLDFKEEWEIWFSITELGKKILNNSYSIFFEQD
jgi:hypothetical protein